MSPEVIAFVVVVALAVGFAAAGKWIQSAEE